MLKPIKLIILLNVFVVCTFSPLSAVDFLPSKHICPVCDNSISVNEIISWGPYVYNWDSKYDLIYSPYTEDWFIWICPKCGYCQLANIFDSLSSEQKILLRRKLADDWEPITKDSISIQTKLQRAVSVNKLLGKNDNFWQKFNRILIFHYRDLSSDTTKMIASYEIKLLTSKSIELSQKEKEYLIGKYTAEIGDNKNGLYHLKISRKLKIGPHVFFIKWGLLLGSVFGIVFVWVAFRTKLWIKIVLTAFLVGGTGFAVSLFVQDYTRNGYYDAIINSEIKRVAKHLR